MGEFRKPVRVSGAFGAGHESFLMESLSLLVLVVSALGMLVAATIFSALGFGVGLVGIPILLMVIDPQSAVMIVNTSSLPLVAWIVLKHREYVHLRQIMPVAIAGFLGALVGAFIIANANDRALGIAILALILVFTVVTAFNVKIPIPYPRYTGPLVGFVVALLITAVGIGGPLLVLFLLARGWRRHDVRSSMALFFVFMISSAVIGYSAAGLFTPNRLLLLAVVAVPVIIGAWLGNRIAHSLNDRFFRYAVVALIMTTSLAALAREVSRL